MKGIISKVENELIPLILLLRPAISRIGFCLLTSLISLFAVNAYAIDWENEYGTIVTAGFDDNFFLSPNNELDTKFNTITLFARVEGSTEVTSVQLHVGINSDTFSESSLDNRITENVLFSVSNQGERLQTSLIFSYAIEPTVTTELLDTGVLVDSARDSINVLPEFIYQLNERNSLSSSFAFRDVSYDTDSFNDFENNSLSFGWQYQIDELSNFSTNLVFSRYDPVDLDVTDTSSVDLSYEMRLTEATTYIYTIGFSDLESSANSRSSSTYGILINSNLDELDSFSMSLSRSYQPSALGVVREEDQLSLDWTHGFSERIYSNLVVDLLETDDREYYEIRPNIRYLLTQSVTISGNYRFRRQDGITGKADSKSFFITLSYID